jgi:hypothetical protein
MAKNHPELTTTEILTNVQMLHGILKSLGIKNASINCGFCAQAASEKQA